MCAAHRLSLKKKLYSSSSKGTGNQGTQGWVIQGTTREAEPFPWGKDLNPFLPFVLLRIFFPDKDSCCFFPTAPPMRQNRSQCLQLMRYLSTCFEGKVFLKRHRVSESWQKYSHLHCFPQGRQVNSCQCVTGWRYWDKALPKATIWMPSKGKRRGSALNSLCHTRLAASPHLAPHSSVVATTSPTRCTESSHCPSLWALRKVAKPAEIFHWMHSWEWQASLLLCTTWLLYRGPSP